MTLRRHVSFRTSLPYDRELHPIGEEVARHLLASLEDALGSKGSLDDWRDSGYELAFVVAGRRVSVALVPGVEQPYDFFAQISSSLFSEVAWHQAWFDERTRTRTPGG
jgi:hypothetical protein